MIIVLEYFATSLGMKFCTWVQSFVPGYEVLYLGMTFCTCVWSFVPGYEVLYLGMKFCTWVWSFVPGYEVLYLGMKFCTWVGFLTMYHSTPLLDSISRLIAPVSLVASENDITRSSWVGYFLSAYEVLYLGIKFCTWVGSFSLGCTIWFVYSYFKCVLSDIVE
jgi:hypothetical protein